MTVLELITSALRAIGQLGPGRTAGPSETTDAVFVLNRLLESWSVDRLTVYCVSRGEYPLTAGDGVYTIGPGGDLDVARPVKYESAAIQSPAYSSEYPLNIIDSIGWAAIGMKGRQGLPVALYPDRASPIESLNLWPIPANPDGLVLYTWSPLASVPDASATLTFPPGYSEALTYNLAIRLAVEWSKPARPEVHALATESLARIRSMNAPIAQIYCDPAFGGSPGRFDIWTGESV